MIFSLMLWLQYFWHLCGVSYEYIQLQAFLQVFNHCFHHICETMISSYQNVIKRIITGGETWICVSVTNGRIGGTSWTKLEKGYNMDFQILKSCWHISSIVLALCVMNFAGQDKLLKGNTAWFAAMKTMNEMKLRFVRIKFFHIVNKVAGKNLCLIPCFGNVAQVDVRY